MPGPFVDDAQVAQARGIASQVIEPVFDLIRRHTTISVERTVLRLGSNARSTRAPVRDAAPERRRRSD